MHFEVFDWIAHHANRTPDKIAMVDLWSNRKISYAGMHERVGRLAGYLHGRLGVRPGARVGLLAQNSSDYLEVQFACFRIGAIFLPLNSRLTVPELTYIVNNASPDVIVYDRDFARTVAGVRARAGIGEVLETAANGTDSPYEAAISAGPVFTDMIRQIMDDVSTVMYTSGTTGLPKGAMITHGMLLVNHVNIGLTHRITADSITLTILPLFHTGGLNVYSNPVLQSGGTVIVARAFDAAECLSMLLDRDIGITNFLAVPANYQFMSLEPEFEAADFSHISVLGIGAAPAPHSLIEAWAERGGALTQVYGMTETAPAVLSLDPADAIRKIGSAGKPLLYTRVRVINEAGEPAAVGETGELWVSGPNVTPGYWNAPEATMEAFDGEWFKTGDAVVVDDEGHHYIVDRWKDMYISGGENVYPAEVENVIYQLNGVAEVAIVGVPHERWGEVGCAVVVSRSDADLDRQAILDHCDGRIARFKLPGHVVFTEALPRNATGKVQKHELRRQIADGKLTV